MDAAAAPGAARRFSCDSAETAGVECALDAPAGVCRGVFGTLAGARFACWTPRGSGPQALRRMAGPEAALAFRIAADPAAFGVGPEVAEYLAFALDNRAEPTLSRCWAGAPLLSGEATTGRGLALLPNTGCLGGRCEEAPGSGEFSCVCPAATQVPWCLPAQ